MLVDYCLARVDKREFLKDMKVLITFLSRHIKKQFLDEYKIKQMKSNQQFCIQGKDMETLLKLLPG